MSVVPGYSSAGLMLVCSWWDGGAWSTPKTFQVTDSTSPATAAALQLATLTVLRNAPEDCRARLTLAYGSNNQTTTVDLRLRRGSPFLECQVTSAASKQWGVACKTAEAGTSATGIVYATSPDASNNSYVIMSGLACTANTTQGALYLTTAGTTVDFGVGASIGASPAATDTPSALLGQYFAAVSEQVTAVGR
jgi:hypothetical protein